jgi:hypothetical protein
VRSRLFLLFMFFRDGREPAGFREDPMSPTAALQPARSRAFAISGLLLIACAVGALLIALMDRRHGLSGLVPLTIFVGAGLSGGLLLWADRRAAFWQQAVWRDPSVGAPAFEHSDLWIVAGLALVGLIPRWIAMRHSLIFDELWTLSFVQQGPLYAVSRQAEYNNHLLNSLLCSLLYEARAALFGSPSASDTSWYPLMRVPSVLFGTAASPLLYLALRTRLSRRVASIAALLLAVSPMAVDLSAQTRGYSAMLCLTIGGAFALDLAVRRGAPGMWLTWLACSTLATLAHLYAAFAVIAGACCCGIATARTDHPEQRRSLLEEAAVMTAVWALLTIVGMAGVLGQMRAGLRAQAGRPARGRMEEILLPMLQRWCGSVHGPLLPLFYLICAILIVAGLLYLRRKAPALALYCLLLLFLPPIVVEIVRPQFVFIRFFIVSLPAFLVCFTCGLEAVGAWGSALWRGVEARALTIAMAGCAVAWSLIRLAPVLQLPKQNFRDAAEFLKLRQQDGAAVALIGVGHQFINRYGVSVFHPASVDDLDRFVRTHGRVLVVDTGIRVEPLPAEMQAYLREHAGQPIAAFPARYADWPYRSLDEEADFTVFEIGPDHR